MKTRIFFGFLVCLLILILILAFTQQQQAGAQEANTPIPPIDSIVELPPETPFNIPTGAPRPTSGAEPVVTRNQPEVIILSEQEALEKTLEIDRASNWETPWSLETWKNDPQRIVIKYYPNASHLGGISSESKTPQPIWVVAIKGKVFLSGPGWSGDFDGVTYVFDQKTGDLLAVQAGFREQK